MLKSVRSLALGAGALALFAAVALPVEAQTNVTIAQDNFDGGNLGWGMTAPINNVGWAIDNTQYAGASAPNCLNYNSTVGIVVPGDNYDSGGTANQGTARSPAYTIASPTYTTFTVSFSCRRHTEQDTGAGTFRCNNHDTCVIRVFDSSSPTIPIYDVQLVDPNLLANMHPPLGIGNEPCVLDAPWHTHTLSIPVPVGTVSVEFVFDTVDGFFNNRPGWYVDDFVIMAVDPGGGGGGGGGGTVTGGYWDPVTGIWVGFPDGSAGTPPPAAPGTGTPVEVGTYNADGVFVGSGTGVLPPPAAPGTGTPVEVGTYNADGVFVGSGTGVPPPAAAPGTGTPVEVGTYNADGVFVGSGTGVLPPPAAPGTGVPVESGSLNANGIYVGSPGSSSSGSGTSEGKNCGLIGLEFLLPLGLLGLLRRRRS